MNIKGVHSWVHPKDKEHVRGIGLVGESDFHSCLQQISRYQTLHFKQNYVNIVMFSGFA
jgi:hypothetical protein